IGRGSKSVPVDYASGEETAVVIRVPDAGQHGNCGYLKRIRAGQSAAKGPALRVVQRSPEVVNASGEDVGLLLRSDRGGATRKASAVSRTTASEGRFKPWLHGWGLASVELPIQAGECLREGLAAKRGHVRNGIETVGDLFAAHHAPHISHFDCDFRAESSLDGEIELVCGGGLQIGIDHPAYASRRISVDAGKERLRKNLRNAW